MNIFDGWTAQTLISGLGAIISVAGAVASWLSAHRKFQFDRNKDLSAVRVSTSHLLRMASGLSHPTWAVGYTAFSDARMDWWDEVEGKRLILHDRAFEFLHDVLVAVTEAEEEVFGVRRVTSDAPAEDDSPPQPMSSDTHEKLRTLAKRLRQDPWLVAR